jgi:hypothetical protein
MHHKKKKAKNARAGCLMCKCNKVNGFNKHTQLGHCGWSKIRDYIASEQDMKDHLKNT